MSEIFLSPSVDTLAGFVYSHGMSHRKDLDKLRKTAESQGWRIVQGRGGHLKWYPPNPEHSMVVTAATPSDRRAIMNIRAELKRRGFVPPEGT